MQEHKFKVVLLGEGRVGKTSILLRYINNTYTEKQESTFQASYQEKTLNIGNNSVKLSIWDTAGQERFHALAPIYYRDSNAAILVFDITDKTSFSKVQHWIEELRKIVGSDIILVIASNKIDLENKRQVLDHTASVYANSVGATIVPSSAKTGKGVNELFLEVTKRLLQKHAKKQSQNKNRRPKPRIVVEDDEHATKQNDSDCACLLL